MLVVTSSNGSLDVIRASFGVTGSDLTQYRSGTRSASLNNSPEDVSDSLNFAKVTGLILELVSLSFSSFRHCRAISSPIMAVVSLPRMILRNAPWTASGFFTYFSSTW